MARDDQASLMAGGVEGVDDDPELPVFTARILGSQETHARRATAVRVQDVISRGASHVRGDAFSASGSLVQPRLAAMDHVGSAPDARAEREEEDGPGKVRMTAED